MLLASTPLKISSIWAQGTGGGYITYPVPTLSQIGITNGAASFETGFPPNSFIPYASGGAGPLGKDFNGITKQITAGMRWQQGGAPITYDSVFSTTVGGYPHGAILSSDLGAGGSLGKLWISQVDNNTSDPDTGGANWLTAYLITGNVTVPQGGTGDVTFTLGAVLLGNNTSALQQAVPNTAGFVLTDNGVGMLPTFQALPASPGFGTITKIVATGAYDEVVPGGASRCRAEAWGAGGGGGFGDATPTCASGGSAGAYAVLDFNVTPGAHITGSVGAGGAGSSSGADGTAGGDTTVIYSAVTYTSGGGPGGLSEGTPSINSPGVAAVSGAWTESIIGGRGQIGFVVGGLTVSGEGGSAPLGGLGGVGGGGGAGSGSGPGGGGGGSGAGSASGNGADGQVTLTFF